jgi:hypothetical protein
VTSRTSDRVSSLAARFVNLSPDTLLALTATEASRQQATADIRSMAASLLRQDEQRGIRRLIRKVIGR